MIVEDGYFIGLPRIPDDLHSAFCESGTVFLYEITPTAYEQDVNKYDRFLSDRGIVLHKAPSEAPRCISSAGGHLVTELDTLRSYSSISDSDLFCGVDSFFAGKGALPMETWSAILVAGGDDVRIKAYNSHAIHSEMHPVYGALWDRNMRMEAVFLAHIFWHKAPLTQNAVYLTNLVEWMHRSNWFSLWKTRSLEDYIATTCGDA